MTKTPTPDLFAGLTVPVVSRWRGSRSHSWRKRCVKSNPGYQGPSPHHRTVGYAVELSNIGAWRPNDVVLDRDPGDVCFGGGEFGTHRLGADRCQRGGDGSDDRLAGCGCRRDLGGGGVAV